MKDKHRLDRVIALNIRGLRAAVFELPAVITPPPQPNRATRRAAASNKGIGSAVYRKG